MPLAHTEEYAAQLIALDTSVQPARFILTDACTLGRQQPCQVVVDNKIVSRVNAKIERMGSYYVLADAGSTNGTFVNRNRIRRPYRLANNDIISLGMRTPQLRFEDTDPTALVNPPDWLDYDATSMWFYLRNYRVELTGQQFRLLLHMYQHIGEPITREQCATILWTEEFSADQFANLDEVIRRLRDSLCNVIPEDAEKRSAIQRTIRDNLIVTRKGIGYVLYVDPADARHEQHKRRR